MRTYDLYVGGEWVHALSGKTFDDYCPSTQEAFGKIPLGEVEDVRAAIDAAYEARNSWMRTPPAKRAHYLLKAASILDEKQDQIVDLLVEESGSAFQKAVFELHYSVGLLREAAAQVHNDIGEVLPSDVPGKFSMVLRQPVGVVGVVAPWNFPLSVSLRGVVFAMAYGNTVVLKPSEETPITGGLLIAQIFEEAGVPKGAFNVVTCPREITEEAGLELVSNPKVRRISYAGPTKAGRYLAEVAGKHLKKIVLELGGKDALVVLSDADIDYAVQAASFGSFFHQGQVCMSVERIIVEEPIAEAFAKRLAEKACTLKVGDPKDPDTIIGPIITMQQLERIDSQVKEALEAGAKAICGAKSEGPYYYPTVLTGVTADMKILLEETLGPVAPVMSVRDGEETVRAVNHSMYGLSTGIITGDLKKGLALAEQIESGMVHINDSSVHDEPHCPFGGVKGSGMGRHGGKVSAENFLERKWITVQRGQRTFSF
jgi:aldehyde dehydrogenase (NAD+)